MSQGFVITGTVNTGETLTGTIGEDTIKGLAGNDSLLGGAGNDTLIGGAGNDTVDGGGGINTVVLSGGRLDYLIPSPINLDANGFVIRLSPDAVGITDGTDTLSHIQVIQFAGETDPVFQTLVLDDHSDAADPGNVEIRYGQVVTGVKNFTNDTDWFRLATQAGQKLDIEFLQGKYHATRLAFSEGSSAGYGGNPSSLTVSQTGTQDISFCDNALDWYGSYYGPASTYAYSFIIRRNWTGSAGNDVIDATGQYEHLVGGAGDDTLTSGATSDSIEGGSGNDVLKGGAGNDFLHGGTGVNTAVYDGNQSDYDVVWQGGTTWKVTAKGGGADGVDTLTDIQRLQFADQSMILDDYSNGVDPGLLSATFGQSITGKANYGGDSDWFQFDFGKLGIGKTLMFTLEGGGSGERVHFTSSDGYTLYFKNASGQDVEWLSTGQSMVLTPDRWGWNSEGGQFIGGKAYVQLYADGASNSPYTLSISRYLEGTAGADILTVTDKIDEIAGLGGDDLLTGSIRSERLLGGEGNDQLFGDAGDDYLSGGSGLNAVQGGAGDDTIDVSGRTVVQDTIDGGDGTDTLRMSQGVNLDQAVISSVEVLESTNGGTFAFSAELLGSWAVTQLRNMDLGLTSAGTVDVSGLSGSIGLVGSTGNDELRGNAESNIIRPLGGNATVEAGAGDDTILYQSNPTWWDGNTQFTKDNFLLADAATRSYLLQGRFDGGAGNDTLRFSLPVSFMHAWSEWANYSSVPYSLDISKATVTGIENLTVDGWDSGNNLPAFITMTASQLAGFSALTGVKGIRLVGGGQVDLAVFVARGGVNLSFGDAVGYTIIGSFGNDTITDTAGNDTIQGGLGNDQLTSTTGQDILDGGSGDDTIFLSGKTIVTDTLEGGDGTDILRVTGGDVDLSGATLRHIESIQVSSDSLSMTAEQWAANSAVSRIDGARTAFILTSPVAGTTVLPQDSNITGLRGSTGDDQLTGNDADNVILGGMGTDTLEGGAGNDTLKGGEGNDLLFGGTGDDHLLGEAGLNTVFGGAGSDVIDVSGRAIVQDTIDGGEGADTLQVSGQTDLTGSSITSIEKLAGFGMVTLLGEQLTTVEILDGVTVSVLSGSVDLAQHTLLNGAKIIGGSGANSMSGTTSADQLEGGAGADQLRGLAGNDSLLGGTGNDTLDGGAGNDTLDGGGGMNTVVFSGSRLDYLIPSPINLDANGFVIRLSPDAVGITDGTDTLSHIQVIQFAGETDPVFQTLVLDDHSDAADPGNVEIRYGQVVTGVKNFTNDTDWFRLATQAGQKLDIEFLQGKYHATRLAFSEGSSAGYGGNPSSLTVSQTGTQDISFCDNALDWYGSYYGPASTYTYSFIIRRNWTGTAGNDVVDGTGLYEHLVGGAGDDTLTSGATSDSIEGGSGNDVLKGGAGNDFLHGGTGVNTVVYDGKQSDYDVVWQGGVTWMVTAKGGGADGVDTLTDIQRLQFADQTVILDDYSNGVDPGLLSATFGQSITGKANYGGDSDWFQFDFGKLGIGKTLMFTLEGGGPGERVHFTSSDGFVLYFKNASGQDVEWLSSGQSMVLTPDRWGGSSEGGQFIGGKAYAQLYADGASNSPYTLSISRYLEGTAGADILTVTDKIDEIAGLGGDDLLTGSIRSDRLLGGEGNDQLLGDAGDDYLSGGSGLNTVQGGTGDDTIDVSGRTVVQDTIDGCDGTDTLRVSGQTDLTGASIVSVEVLSGSGTVNMNGEQLASIQTIDAVTVTVGAGVIDFNQHALLNGAQIFAGLGDNTLIGTTGTDYLNGGVGKNSIHGGAGDDTIDVSGRTVVQDTIDGGDGVDTLRISQGVNLDQAVISSVEVLESTNGGTFAFSAELLGSWAVTQLRNMDLGLTSAGTVDVSGLSGSIGLVGSTGNDELRGNAESNIIRPLGGNATVEAGAGDDTILYQSNPTWWDGNTQFTKDNFLLADVATRSYLLQGRFDGGTGNDTLWISFPVSFMHAWNEWAINSSTPYSLDISKATVTGIEKLTVDGCDSGSNLPAFIITTASQLAGFSALTGVKGIQLVGGGEVDLAAFAAKGGVNLSFGDTVGYTIIGTSGNDTITDSAGNDTIQGGLGNDQLTSTTGQDILDGKSGNDTIVVAGKTVVTDTLDGGDGTDILRITGGDVDLSGATLRHIESIQVSSDSLSMTAEQWAANGTVSRIDGAHTAFILTSPVAGTTALPLDSNITGLRGSTGDDHLTGNDADNVILGGMGTDNLEGGAGNDTLKGGEGNDLLSGGTGDDHLLGEAGFNTVFGGAGSDVIDVSGRAIVQDTIDGGEGADTLQISGQTVLTGSSITSIEKLAGFGMVTLLGEQLTTVEILDGVTVSVLSGSVDLAQHTLLNGAKIIGGSGANSMSGTTSADQLEGGAGADQLRGLAGNDSLLGGTGNDTLDGGAGNDTLDGGGGMNTVVLSGGRLDYLIPSPVNIDANGFVIKLSPDAVGNSDGTDTLSHIQVIKFAGETDPEFQTLVLDDHSDAADPGNLEIQYGQVVTGVKNFTNDTDWFRLATQAGQKLDIEFLQGKYHATRLAFSEGSSAGYGGNPSSLTVSQTGTQDISFCDNALDWYGSYYGPASTYTYSFIIRRNWTGTAGNDVVDGTGLYEHLVGGAGDDTLTSGATSDSIEGGSGNDVLKGGAGNDFLHGGTGVNTVVYDGKQSDYDVVWQGGVTWKVTAKAGGADGVDTLTDIQRLQFADQSVILDDSSNGVDPGLPSATFGQFITGKANYGGDSDWFQFDFGKLGIGKTLMFTLEGGGPGERVHFTNSDGYILYFKNASGQDVEWLSIGQSLVLTPDRWGGSSEGGQFIGGKAYVQLYADGASNSPYTLSISRYLEGTAGADILTVTDKIDELAGLGGDDLLTGSIRSERLLGGEGNDQLFGDAGDDYLSGGSGLNAVQGGAGDDTIDVSGRTVVQDTIDGGDGTDTLRMSQGVNLDQAVISSVEVLESTNGGTFTFSAEQLGRWGVTQLRNMDLGLTSSGILDVSGLSGSIGLVGSTGNDKLRGNAESNIIRPLGGNATVEAGAGDDTILYQSNPNWWDGNTQFTKDNFLLADAATRSYLLRGRFDGGAGNDTLRFSLSVSFMHAWSEWANYSSVPYSLDISKATVTGIENLTVDGWDSGNNLPAFITMMASQLAGFSALTGVKGIQLVGGGEVDLAAFAARGGVNLDFGDAVGYTIIGTSGNDILKDTSGCDVLQGGTGNDQLTSTSSQDTLLGGSGNDTLVVSGKSIVTDTFDGGEGIDTLRITGGDIDFSGAFATNVEKITVSADSIALTASQWNELGSFVERVSGTQSSFILKVSDIRTVSLSVDSPYSGLTGSSGDDRLIGNAGNNVLLGGSGNDDLSGNAGDDRLVSGAGIDTLSGGDGSDTLMVTDKLIVHDQLEGGAGQDTLVVLDGQDLTTAVISGLEILSGSGIVTLTSAQLAGFQTIKGVSVQLSGTSTLFSMGLTQLLDDARVLMPLVDPALNAIHGILGSKESDTIGGGSGGDVIYGGRGSDHLDGGAGSDTLIGGIGVDTLLGGAGDDLFRVETGELTGGLVSSDIMDGGSGSDTVEVNFSTASSTYQVNAGTISNIERLAVNNANASWCTVALTAETWSRLTAVTFSNPDSYAYGWTNLSINGNGNNISFNNIVGSSKIARVTLAGAFFDIDASKLTIGSTNNYTDTNYRSIFVSNFDSILLSEGDDALRISGDESFVVNAGAGDDRIFISNVRNLPVTINGGEGVDILDLSNNSFVDLSQTTLASTELIRYGGATLVVTEAQLGNWIFEGSGTKFTRAGSVVFGTTGNDSYVGNGAGAFQGGRGDDSISYVDTAVFSGNMAEYNYVRSGPYYVVEHALGTPVDGRDTLYGVMNIKFADITLQLDDAPDNLWGAYQYSSLTVAGYDKRISANKDYVQDTDVFAATLAPNSPLAVEASSSGGSGWGIYFMDIASGQQLQFKSLVYGSVISTYYNWMSASEKWLPGFNTSDGFKAYQGGAVALQYNLDGDIQEYAFTLKYLDDYAGSVDTTGVMDVQGGEVRGYIGAEGDADWIRTTLNAGTKYEFHLNGLASGGGTLLDPSLVLRDSEGRLVASGLDIQTNVVGGDDIITFRPVSTGVYYLAVQDVGGVNLGSWTLTQKSLDMIAGNISTTERVEWNASHIFTVSSEVNVLGDHDWFRIWLDKGLTYDFRALGSSSGMGNTLGDPQLSLYSVTGNLLATDNNGGGGTDARLIYRASDSGWYFLDAGASGNMTKGNYTLTGASLQDDYGNSVLTNGRAQVDIPLYGLISFNGDTDWVKVGMTKGQTYIIELNGDLSDGAQLDPLVDPLLVIRDFSGSVLYKADDFGGSLNARAYFTAPYDGAYYFEARSAFKYDVGAWQLSVVTAPPDDYVDTVAAAAAHPESVGQLSLGVAGSGVIGAPGDHDLFSTDMEAGKVYQIKAEGLSGHAGTLVDPYLRVFDANGHLVDFANNGAAGRDAQLYLTPTVTGSYFLEISSNQEKGLGTFQITANQRNLPPDDVPNDLSTQVTLSAGDSFAGQLLTHNDQDWFGIILAAQKDYVFRVQASDSGNGTLLDPVLEVRAGDGTLVKSSDNSLISHEPFMVFTPVAQGTYYLVVKAADGQTDTGSYTLLTRAPDDYSDSKPGATLISLDQTLDGAIQWAYGSYGVRAVDSVGVPSDADADWFKFSASAGEVLSVTVQATANSTLSRPMVEIVDTNNLTLAVGDGMETLNGKAQATFRTTESGIFYVRVIDGAGATGEYQIRLSAGDASDEDATAPVAIDFTSQGALSIAQVVAKIGVSSDVDTFNFTLQGGHHYRIETMAVRDGSTAPLQSASLGLSWFASGESMPQSVAVSTTAGEPSFYESSAFSPLTSGHLSVTVQSTDSTQTGQYKLRVVDLGVTTEDVQPDQVSNYVDATHGVLAINSSVNGVIDTASDIDLFAITLTAGNIYDFSLKGFADGLGTLAQGTLQLLDSSGSLVTTGRFDAATGRAQMAVSVFADGRYYLAAGAVNQPGNTGTYMLDTRLRDITTPVEDDISADTRSGVTVMPGRPATGSINYAGDTDWISATLTAGKVYIVDQLGDGDGAGGTLKDGFLRILDSSGNEVAFDDNSGAGSDARLIFTPQSSQAYYFEVSGTGAETGTYTLRLRELYGGIADPLKSAQWYLPAIGLEQLNNQYSGAGITIGLVDDGIDTSHPDLQSQIDFALSYDAVYKTQDGKHKTVFDFHGTMVAGIMVATANNETGIVGIAPDAEIASTRVNWKWEAITDALGKQYQFDISNNSWSAVDPFGDNFNSTTLTFAYEALRRGVENGRGQNGTVFVFSAGNSASSGDNTNYHNFQNAREVITVAAAQSDGSLASFSTPGANVLVGAYGVGLLTTVRGGHYANFSGTSGAAPVVSGVVALMLEANPNLGYRDVQKILALSATHSDNQSWKINGATSWNLGGLHYNDGMGFGLVDAYAAVQLALTWTDSNTAINEVSDSARAFGLHDAIPDGDGTVYSRKFMIDSAMQVEHLELGIDLRHTRLGDLVIEVISPNGTVSRLMDRPTVNADQPFGLAGEDSGVPIHLFWDFSSVQFMGEQAVGDWTVVVKDVRAEETGTIYSLSLRVYGERADGNDTYVFTEEGFRQQGAAVLQDESGIDTINASVMLHDTFIDLSAGLIAAEGVTYNIADWSVIEQAFTGAGNDRLVGNSAVNWLKGGAGSDTLEGGAGNDTLDGGAGSDTVVYAGAMAEYNISWNPDTKQVTVIDNKITGGDDGQDTLVGIERLVFSDGDLSLGAMVGNHAPVAKATLFDNPILFAKGMGIQYDLPDNAFTDADSGGSANVQIEISSASGGELPEWLSYDPVTRQFSGVPPVDLQGQIKVLVKAIDEFGTTASDILTLQFGDNQAPLLDNPSEKVLLEDAGLVALAMTAPVDPEGKAVTVKVLDITTFGTVLDKLGNIVSAGQVFSADAFSELHYQTAPDANGNAGYLRYQATDADGVMAESSVHLFVDAVNDAPRFPTAGSKLVLNYPAQSTVTLDMNHPADPESVLTTVRLTELPAMGTVSLDGHVVALNQVLTFDQLDRLTFTLAENVNGPIGAVSIQAVDPQGLVTNWSLSLEVQGAAASNVGTAGTDALYGSIGNDTLYGMGGNDTLVGNAGNDRLLGGLGNDTLFGGSGNDALDGSSGNDYLDGGSGNDTMSGGPGNDTYLVDSLADVVLEVISVGTGGKDLVLTSVSLTATDNVESLQAAPGYAINLTGNALDNTLVGNELANLLTGDSGRDTLVGGAGNDTLHGGSGIDHLAGGAGDDLYHVDSRSDVVVELLNEGVDTVRASSSFTLSSNVENLILEEGGDYTAGGNSLNNHIWGNAGNNILAGGLGIDTLEGGLGNDVYVLSDSLDTIIDTGGTDTVRSTLDITLQAGMENAELVGIGDTVAVGNGTNNLLVGNSGDNILEGMGGVDTLTGGEGSDQFIVSYNGAGTAPDRIPDFTPGRDLLVIDLASLGIFPDALGLLSSGTVASDSFVRGAGARALDLNDYFLLDTAQGLLLFDPDGSGPVAPMELVQLVGVDYATMIGADIFVGV